MTELLFFKWSHLIQSVPTPPTKNVANLPKRFDLIVAKPSDVLTDISWQDGIVTATMTAPHNVPVGQLFQIQDVVPTEYNGIFKARYGTSGDTLIYNLVSDPGTATTLGMVGWPWSVNELTNPWFRILIWHRLQLNDALEFLHPLEPELDINSNPTTHRQYRGSFLDLNHVSIPVALRNWWQDDTRAEPKFLVPANLTPSTVLNAIRNARPPIAVS